MLHLLLNIGIVLFAFNLSAFELPDEHLGHYEVLIGQSIESGNKFLDCEVQKNITITSPQENSFELEGISKEGSLEFNHVNQGVIGQNQELLNYAEHRNFTENISLEFSVISQVRSCSSTLGETFGCIGKTWRKTKKVRFFKKIINGTEGSYLRIDYQPLANQPLEFCILKKLTND